MANPAINFAGFLYDDSGDAVSGATINLYDKNTSTTSRANTTTNSSGYWNIAHTTAGEFDIQITSGSSKRRIKFDDKIHLSEVDTEVLNVRGNEGAAAPMYWFADEGDDAGDRWLFNAAAGGVFTMGNDLNTQGTYVAHVTITPNATVANSTFAVAGNVTVGNALTVTGTTTLNGNLVLGDAAADTLTVGATLQGASPLTFEGGTADGHETTFAITDPTADRTITFPNLSGTVQLSGNPISGTTIDASTDFTIGDTVITDGVVTDSTGLQLAANLDINGTVDISGDLTLSAGGDGALVFGTAGENSIKIPDNQASALIIEEANNAYMTFVSSNSSEKITFAKALDIDADVQIDAAVTVGVDDTGHDVKFFGASSGAYFIYDQSEDQVEIRGAAADATTSTGKLLLSTALTDINANDVIGKVSFQAPLEAGGTDAITVAASIEAVAQGTFSASVNATDIIFKTGHSEAATEKFRITSQGELGIGGATYGSSGDVLTSGGAGAAPSWAAPTTGDITGVTAGDGLSGGGSSGGVTVTLDLNELTAAAVADGDFIPIIDTNDSNGSRKEAVHDIATLFAGAGMTATSSVMNVIGGDGITANTNDVAITAAQTTITSVYNTSLKMGRDSQNLIDFATTDNKIILRVNNVDEVELVENALSPVTASGVDLGTASLEWGNIYIGDDKKIYLGTGSDASIEYDEDGTDQLRIAGNTIFENQVELAKDILLDSTPADPAYSGITAKFTAGETLEAGEVVYFKAADSKMWKAVANTGGRGLVTAEIMCVAMAAEDISADAVGVFLLQGFLHDATNFPTYAIGETLYVPEAEVGGQNVPEGAAPDTDGDMVQVIGWAASADSVYFSPNFTMVEVA